MARESEFVQKLSDFTKSLGDLVDLLKEETKGYGGEVGGSETLNMMCESMDEKMTTVVDTLQGVKEDVMSIKEDTSKINKAVENLKTEKEKGIVGDVGDKKNQNQILDGVKTIVLIAGAVLAIGMAFKIVGHVDLFSVVALGMGIMFVAQAFIAVASMKDDKGKPIGLKKSLITAGIIVLMSAAILSASLILDNVKPMDPMTLITIVAIGLTMGIVTYFMMKGISKLSVKEIAMLPLVPIVIPVIAGGIVLAGYILQNMPDVDNERIWSALKVSIALVPMVIAFGLLLKGLKNTKATDLLIVGLAIPVMAYAIVLSSQILSNVEDINLEKLLYAGIGIAGVTLAMIPTIWLLKKSGLLTPKAIIDLLIGVGAIVLISTAVMLASWILSVGNYEKYPDFEWSAGVGLSLLAFSVPIFGLGMMISLSGGLGLIALGAGILGVVIIATAIVEVAKKLNEYNWSDTKYPSYEWSASVGLSLVTFGLAIMLAAPLALLNGVMSMFGAGIGDSLLLIVDVIVDVAERFNKSSGVFDVSNVPSPEWAGGVGGAIMAFASALSSISSIGSFLGMGGMSMEDFKTSSLAMVDVLIEVGEKFNKNNMSFDDTNVPSKKWADGVGGAITAFTIALSEISDIGSFLGMGGMSMEDFKKSSIDLVGVLIAVGKEFNKSSIDFNESNIPSPEWATGVSETLNSFTKIIDSIDTDNTSAFTSLLELVKLIRYIGIVFRNFENFDTTIPQTISSAITTIISAIPNKNTIDPLWSLIYALKTLSNISWTDILDIKLVSKVIGDLASEIDNINNEKVLSLNKLGAGLHMISLIDETRLRAVLNEIEAKSDTIQEIMDDGGFIRNIFDGIFDDNKNNNNNKKTETNDVKSKKSNENYQEKLLAYIENIDENLESLNENSKKNFNEVHESLSKPEDV